MKIYLLIARRTPLGILILLNLLRLQLYLLYLHNFFKHEINNIFFLPIKIAHLAQYDKINYFKYAI